MSRTKIYTVSTLEDSNQKGTLRWAINQANADKKLSEIQFSIIGTIKLNSSLPCICKPLNINGTSAPGYYGVPMIEIDCNNSKGLTLDKKSNNSTIQGLSITNASNSGITIHSDSSTIILNFIGLDLYGKIKGNKKNGICICDSNNNTIGSNPNNISANPSNVISGNGENGIKLFKSSNNTIVSNYIGTNITGEYPIPNKKNGIHLTKRSSSNTIGGTVYTNSQGITNNPTGNKGTIPIVYIFPPLGNLISGNDGNGVLADKNSSKNVFNGNFIGTNYQGIVELGNQKNGICIESSNDNVLRGCTFVENPFVYYNVCSGNALNGISINNSNNTIVQGNFAGIGASNAVIVPNGLNGVKVSGTSKNTVIGGPIPLGNVFSGNLLSGTSIQDEASGTTNYNTFAGIYAFQGAAPNGLNGISISSSGENNIITTCITSGNFGNGVEINGEANGVTIDTLISGLDSNGQNPIPNQENGILITGNAKKTLLGKITPSIETRVVCSGNFRSGITISGNANNNTIKTTFTGLTIFGTNNFIGNIKDGITISGNANNNYIGVDPPIEALTNFSAANIQYGINLTENCSNNIVKNNFVGYTLLKQPIANGFGAIKNDSLKSDTNIIINNTTYP